MQVSKHYVLTKIAQTWHEQWIPFSFTQPCSLLWYLFGYFSRIIYYLFILKVLLMEKNPGNNQDKPQLYVA